MSNVIGGVLVLLALVVAVMCLIGLITPKWLKYKKTGDAPKRSLIALVLLFVPIILLGIGGSLIDDPAKESSSSVAESISDSQEKAVSTVLEQSASPIPIPAPKAAEPKNFGMTAEEFRKAYNSLIGQVDKSWRVAEFDIVQGAVNDTFTAKLSESAGMVGTVDKASKKLISMMVVAGGGQNNNNMQSIAVVLTTAHVLTQGASKEEINNAVSTLVTDALNGIEKTDTQMQSRTVGNRKFSATASQITGLMFTVSSQP